MQPSFSQTWPASPRSERARRWAWIVHILFIASFFFGITSIPGVIVAYMKRGEAEGTIYESHFTYAIRTFWLGLLGAMVAGVLCLVMIGYVLLALLFVWWLVRVIRPVIALVDEAPIRNPRGWF
ncbi:DUF4870 family protein [Asaia lannensis]|uniref:DUF4870 domain-containing protein n=1 Tax=Asaia lannensis NBRC 102526 TaxID=1307926 RepID=A0ABT1CIQ7_9PROT|nr:DUF4870 domain-containing protein [Asaia lannensis]MCO6159869.1 hypothetical protein [Asaia lannensis NBRC 102526]GBQ95978.1 hypothetical protein AA102526_0615 [Asaia lannensis NBRC 102526]